MSNKKPLVPSAASEMQNFKMEVARDIGVADEFSNSSNSYMGDISSRTAGKIGKGGNLGGEMVKRMIASVEKDMANKR